MRNITYIDGQACYVNRRRGVTRSLNAGLDYILVVLARARAPISAETIDRRAKALGWQQNGEGTMRSILEHHQYEGMYQQEREGYVLLARDISNLPRNAALPTSRRKKKPAVDLLSILALAQKHWPLCKKIIFNYGLPDRDAPDILQEAAMNVWRGYDSFDLTKSHRRDSIEQSFRNWYAQIVRNLCIDYLRTARNRERTFSELLGEEADLSEEKERAWIDGLVTASMKRLQHTTHPTSPLDLLIRKEEKENGQGNNELLHATLAHLPRGQQKAIVLTRINGLPEKEAARILDVAPSTVRWRVHAGLKKMRERALRNTEKSNP